MGDNDYNDVTSEFDIPLKGDLNKVISKPPVTKEIKRKGRKEGDSACGTVCKQ